MATSDRFNGKISNAYVVVEMYEYGSMTQRDYLEACKFALDYFEKKYGKNDFRFRHLFAHMQGDDWENTFDVRCLLHAESIGCFHKTIVECDKHKTGIEADIFKGQQCQHCRWLEGVQEEWTKKDQEASR